MPPVREASAKPSAATVLPAPVACSNQKRLAALGSSAALGDVLVRVRPVDRILVAVLVLLQLLGQVLLARQARRARARPARRRPRRSCARCRCAATRPAARSACPTARRPGGPRAPCRRRAPARPGRAGGRGPAAATSGAASASRAPWRPRRARSARRRAPCGAACRARARSRRPRPSSRKGSRANEAARSRSSEDGRDATARVADSGSAMKARLIDVREKSRGPPRDFEQPGPQWGGVVWSARPGSNAYSSRVKRQLRPICHRMSRCDGLRPFSPGSSWSRCWSSVCVRPAETARRSAISTSRRPSASSPAPPPR